MQDLLAECVVGVWIDHRETTLVFVSEAAVRVSRVRSRVERHPRRSSLPASGPYEAQLVQADDSRERRYSGLLARYYDAVITRVATAPAILICGPGEAKGELRKRLERTPLPDRVVCLESAQRMTDRQLVRRVREHFRVPALATAAGGDTGAREERG